MSEAQEWADKGLATPRGNAGDLLEQLAEIEFPMTLEQAGPFLRAAYGGGYHDGLASGEVDLETAERFALELDLRLPTGR